MGGYLKVGSYLSSTCWSLFVLFTALLLLFLCPKSRPPPRNEHNHHTHRWVLFEEWEMPQPGTGRQKKTSPKARLLNPEPGAVARVIQ